MTASGVAELARGLVDGADIEIGETLGPDDRFELNIRGALSVDNARRQLGWTPRYPDMPDGVAEYIDRYRAFLAGSSREDQAPDLELAER